MNENWVNSLIFSPVLEKHSLYQTECLFPFLEEVKKLKTDIQLERKIFHLNSREAFTGCWKKSKGNKECVCSTHHSACSSELENSSDSLWMMLCYKGQRFIYSPCNRHWRLRVSETLTLTNVNLNGKTEEFAPFLPPLRLETRIKLSVNHNSYFLGCLLYLQAAASSEYASIQLWSKPDLVSSFSNDR